jgi:hypothetical protein
MSFQVAACCAAVLSQQHASDEQTYLSEDEDKLPTSRQPTSRNCTIVEDGRVVVKPIQAHLDQADVLTSTDG